MKADSAHGTISINRLVKIVIVTAIAFGVGFLGMALVNRLGYLMAGALCAPLSLQRRRHGGPAAKPTMQMVPACGSAWCSPCCLPQC